MSSGGEMPHHVTDPNCCDECGQPLNMLAVTPAQIDEGVDTLHRTALGVAKILLLGHNDVPRLLIAASCRSVEQMIEMYERRAPSLDVTGAAQLKLNIAELATALHTALVEAVATVEAIRTSLTPPDRPVGGD